MHAGDLRHGETAQGSSGAGSEPLTRPPAIPRRVRAWVGCLFALLLVPGLIGFDLWPLTGWRMYSVSNTALRTDWAVEAATPRGAVDLRWSDMPLAYRLAAWPLSTLPGASLERREGMCLALLEGVREVIPDASGVTIVRDEREMHDDDSVSTARERFHECGSG